MGSKCSLDRENMNCIQNFAKNLSKSSNLQNGERGDIQNKYQGNMVNHENLNKNSNSALSVGMLLVLEISTCAQIPERITCLSSPPSTI
jgi:hypothetical protein